MTNGLVQHIALEESSSIQWVKVNVCASMSFPPFFEQETNTDLLYASLDDKILPKGVYA